MFFDVAVAHAAAVKDIDVTNDRCCQRIDLIESSLIDRIADGWKSFRTVQIRDGKNVPETFPQLYQLFEKWYTEREKKVPEQRHFIRKMREELGVESGKKKIQPYLYAFVGKYDKMSLELLAEGTALSMVSNASWLFVRLRSKISSTDKKNTHFYYLSRKLKEKFPQDILFLSFDVDTLVILCKNEESKNRVQSHFHSIEEEQSV